MFDEVVGGWPCYAVGTWDEVDFPQDRAIRHSCSQSSPDRTLTRSRGLGNLRGSHPALRYIPFDGVLEPGDEVRGAGVYHRAGGCSAV